MTIKTTVDLSEVFAGLDKLVDARESLARSMAVAAGRAIRDEAKARAPVETGRLQSSIYLAYRDAQSSGDVVVYSISWNSRKAPHGHLLEFGHWQTHALYKGRDGEWHVGAPLASPKWVSAKPFLRPAYDALVPTLGQIMVQRGRERLAELLGGDA